MFEGIADSSAETMPENEMQVLGVTEEDLPTVRAQAKDYIKKIDQIEKIYNENVKNPNIHEKLVPLLTEGQIRLADSNNRNRDLKRAVEDSKKTISNFDELSTSGKAIFNLKAGISGAKNSIKFLKNRIYNS